MTKSPSETTLAALLVAGLHLFLLLALSRPSASGAFRPTEFRMPARSSSPEKWLLGPSSSFAPSNSGARNYTLNTISNLKDVAIPNIPTRGEHDRTKVPSLLFGGTGCVVGLGMACNLPALSWGWFCSIPVLILASYATARSTLPFAAGGKGIDIPDEMYARNLGAHIFSTTSVPILTSLMWPLLDRVAQKGTFLLSMLFVVAGLIAEIYAHFNDSWVFKEGCRALQGNENAMLYIGLTGAFSFLASTFSPSLWSLSLASVPVAFLTYSAVTRPWKESKGLAIPANAVSSIAACAVLIRKFRSAWPLLFYFQSINIVRNSTRIVATEKQNLHLLPSAYGWFSYVIPFALSLHPVTRSASLWTVLGVCALSVVGTDFLEQKIIKYG